MTDVAPVKLDPTRSWKQTIAGLNQGVPLSVILAVICLGSTAFVPGFGTLANLQAVALGAVPLGVLAAASSLVILGKGIDVSLMAVVPIAAIGVVVFGGQGALGEVRGIVIVFAIGIGIGLLNGLLIAFGGLPSLFVTLGTWQLFAGLFAVVFFTDQVYALPRGSTFLRSLGSGDFWVLPRPVVIAVVILVLAHLFVANTPYGHMIRAQGDSVDAAWQTGLPARTLTMLSYVASSVLGVVAGLVLLAVNGYVSQSAQGVGEVLLFNAITAAVIGGVSLSGGRGSIGGVAVGVAFVALMQNITILLNFDIVASTCATGCIMLIALAADAWLRPVDAETARSEEL